MFRKISIALIAAGGGGFHGGFHEGWAHRGFGYGYGPGWCYFHPYRCERPL
jgi:hypothetical protein